MTNILDLDNTQAKQFFLEGESYFNSEIPKYLVFGNALADVDEAMGGCFSDDPISQLSTDPKRLYHSDDVNYKLLNNKNGKYAWRLYQLIHPALYVALVNEMTEISNWHLIQESFADFSRGAVECMSLPAIKEDNDKTNKGRQILEWWDNVEQKSIALAMDYEYLFHTDITNCYSSIYTHTITWALHSKEVAKRPENRGRNCQLLGCKIDNLLMAMSNGQTNGIPEGSVLMDFLAEIILGYVDLELTKALKASKDVKEYKIIRYRDDYRIFVNNPKIGEEIIKRLSAALYSVGMRLSSEKTKSSSDVITSSIKSDKFYWITQNSAKNNLQKSLLAIYNISNLHPNSGVVVKELQRFYGKIKNNNHKKEVERNCDVLVSIIVNIAFKNPRVYPIFAALLSVLLSFQNDSKKKEIVESVLRKFSTVPNTEYLELWLQRISITFGNPIDYEGKLCQKVIDPSVQIWNSEWLVESLVDVISNAQIIDQDELNSMDDIIDADEFAIFPHY